MNSSPWKSRLGARYHENLLNRDINGDGSMDLQDGHVIGARYRWGNEKAALLVEGSSSDIEYSVLEKKDKYTDVMLGLEHSLGKDLWLQLAWGDRSGSDLPDSNEKYSSGQFRWAFSENSLR